MRWSLLPLSLFLAGEVGGHQPSLTTQHPCQTWVGMAGRGMAGGLAGGGLGQTAARLGTAGARVCVCQFARVRETNTSSW